MIAEYLLTVFSQNINESRVDYFLICPCLTTFQISLKLIYFTDTLSSYTYFNCIIHIHCHSNTVVSIHN